MAEARPPTEGIVLTHFIVSDDVERSRRFYTDVLGGTLERSGEPTNVALANSWIVINAGGGPTDDKPAVTLQTPRDLDRVSSFLNIRVKDIAAVYAEWSARGAQFLTPPKQHQYEIRCYVRDPDGHLIEVGQTTDPEGGLDPPSVAVEYGRRRARVNDLCRFASHVACDVARQGRMRPCPGAAHVRLRRAVHAPPGR
jgi:catechol 2,3-dioxygenase-like lactoylglutathione lyase family enzyme